MQSEKDITKKTKKDFNPKDAVLVFSSFTFICIAIMFILNVYDILTLQNILSFDKPIKMILNIIVASFALLLFGIALSLYIPSKYIEDTNNSYQQFSLLSIFSFMFLGALFEELLFRGIIQTLLFVFIENQWIAIIITTLCFLGFHTHYFKKPIMLINISVPSLTFGWIYFETNNILVPFIVHFLMNIGITLLFKYNVLSIKK